MTQHFFHLSSHDCELLLAFESAHTLSDLARKMGKDVSVISRQLQRIAGHAPVLEKFHGRWRVTTLGRELNKWTLESISQQKALLHGREIIRVGATRTFANKALSANLDFLRSFQPETSISLHSIETGVEKSLLDGEIDIGFACGKPINPSIAFERCAPERYVAAASPRFLRKHKISGPDSLRGAPHLLLSTTTFPFPPPELVPYVKSIYAVFNDLLCTMEAALAHKGWGFFPWYSVSSAVQQGGLQIVPGIPLQDEIYGVWWLRERKSLKPWVRACFEFLQTLRLS